MEGRCFNLLYLPCVASAGDGRNKYSLNIQYLPDPPLLYNVNEAKNLPSMQLRASSVDPYILCTDLDPQHCPEGFQ